jgi:hypothetical protein
MLTTAGDAASARSAKLPGIPPGLPAGGSVAPFSCQNGSEDAAAGASPFSLSFLPKRSTASAVGARQFRCTSSAPDHTARMAAAAMMRIHLPMMNSLRSTSGES